MADNGGLSSQLADENHRFTRAIITAFNRVDWDELTRVAGNLPLGLARLAAAAAWMEQQTADLTGEAARRHREAQHRASVNLVTNHPDEWKELMRRHRADVDAERDAAGHSLDGPTPGPKTARSKRRLLDRIKGAMRKHSG